MPSQKSSIRDILLAVRARLVDQGVFTNSTCWLSLKMKPRFHDVGGPYGIILPLTQQTITSSGDGGGRYSKLVRGRFNVYVRTQLDIDEAERDTEWLTNETLGATQKWDDVEDALEGHFLLDPDGTALTAEPVRHLFTGEPHKNYYDPSWGDVVMEFETLYMRDLDTTDGG